MQLGPARGAESQGVPGQYRGVRARGTEVLGGVTLRDARNGALDRQRPRA